MFKKGVKKINSRLFREQKGYTALLMTVLVLTTILTATLSVASIVQRGLSMNWEQVHSVKSLFASEGGMERILYETRKGVVVDFNDVDDGDCVEFDASYDLVTIGTHIQGDPACFGAGDANKIVPFSNGAEYRLQHNNLVGASNMITLTSYGAYEDQNRVVKSSYSVPLCGPSTPTKPGCMVAAPVNSHDNLNYCNVAGYCFECDFGWKNCVGPNNDCDTQLGTNLNCMDCGDVCIWPSVCRGISVGCSADSIPTYCGDGLVQLPNATSIGGPLNDGFEACDDGNINPNDGCDDCTITSCGDGTLQPALEDCEGANLNWATCASEGFDGGVLACTAFCTYDYSGCCNDAAWSPAANTECLGDSVYQTNGCGGQQIVIGTKTCDDSNDCTADSCNSLTDNCSWVNLADGTPCAGGTCLGGACCSSTWVPNANTVCLGVVFLQSDGCGNSQNAVGTLTCDDGNPCTTDSCNAGVCSAAVLADGTACGSGKVCQGGSCVFLPTTLYVNADDNQTTYFNGALQGTEAHWENVSTYTIFPGADNVIAITADDDGDGGWGLSVKLYFGVTLFMSTDAVAGWKCTNVSPPGAAWRNFGFNDSGWTNTMIFTRAAGPIGGNSLDVRQIWTSEANVPNGQIWCRYKF